MGGSRPTSLRFVHRVHDWTKRDPAIEALNSVLSGMIARLYNFPRSNSYFPSSAAINETVFVLSGSRLGITTFPVVYMRCIGMTQANHLDRFALMSTIMVQMVIIPKSGEPEQMSVRDATSTNLYKKAGLKTASSFERRVVWKVGCEGNVLYVALFAKDEGSAGRENKCDLPPPIDKELYFGKIVVVAARDAEIEDIVDFPIEMWTAVYEKLFGGFENIADTDDESESDDDIPAELLTKDGYMRDGFVVDGSCISDAESEDDGGDSGLSASDYESEGSVELFTSNI